MIEMKSQGVRRALRISLLPLAGAALVLIGCQQDPPGMAPGGLEPSASSQRSEDLGHPTSSGGTPSGSQSGDPEEVDPGAATSDSGDSGNDTSDGGDSGGSTGGGESDGGSGGAS
jgi:hypothetical protein